MLKQRVFIYSKVLVSLLHNLCCKLAPLLILLVQPPFHVILLLLFLTRGSEGVPRLLRRMFIVPSLHRAIALSRLVRVLCFLAGMDNTIEGSYVDVSNERFLSAQLCAGYIGELTLVG